MLKVKFSSYFSLADVLLQMLSLCCVLNRIKKVIAYSKTFLAHST